MTQRYVAPKTITPVVTIPTDVQCAEIEGFSEDLAVVCELDNNTGTNITHNIYGYLRNLSQFAVILIATYNNLETIPTVGKYSHLIPKGAMQYRAIGVQSIIGAGAINSQVIKVTIQ